MLRRNLLVVVAVILTLSSLCIDDVLASKGESQEIVNFNGRLLPKSLADRYKTSADAEGHSAHSASFTSLANLQGANFAVSKAPDNQILPKVAYNSNNNNCMIVWSDARNQISSGVDVYGQLVSSSGSLIGSNFAISQAPDDQWRPDVAYNSTDNEYLVIWYDNQRSSVYGQRLSDTGTKLGNEFFVLTSSDLFSSIAYNSRDNMYLVVSPFGDYTDFAGDLHGRLVSNKGVPQSNSFPICTADGPQAEPAIAYNSIDNEYMVLWTDFRNSMYYLQEDVYGQIISSTGTRVGANFAVSSIAGVDWEAGPCIAYNSDRNEYIAAWYDDRNYPEEDIYGCLMGSNGIVISSDLPICNAGKEQDWPHVDYSSIGKEYLVVWMDYRNEGWDVYGQRVPDDGMMQEGNFSVSTARYGQGYPRIAHNHSTNEYLVTWFDERDKDTNGTDIYAQRITSPDRTPPSLPSDLASTTHIPEQWSDEPQIVANWTPATDVGSGVDGYSALWDEEIDSIPPETKNLEESVTEATSPSLSTGQSHYFHIRTVDNAGNWSEAAHIGPFFVDADKPSEVTDLVSSTHTSGEWNPAQVVKVSWTPAQDSGSGLAGYSSIWDTSPDTLPAENTNLGADVTETDSPVLADGNSHYFHIRSADTAGNLCDTAVHIGPFFIDSTPPTLVSGLSSPSHEVEVCSSSTVVQVTWTSATDESSGLKGYSVLWDTSPDTLPDDTVELDPDVTETASAELPDGTSHYFHIRSVDNTGNTMDEAVHIGPFYIKTTGPVVTNPESTSHEVGVWSNDDTVDVNWSLVEDQCSMISGYSVIWDSQSDTIPDEVKDIEGDLTALTSPVLTGRNIFYFHIRGVDSLELWGETAHLGPFFIDISKPSGVTDLVSTSHTSGEWNSAQVVKVSWTPAQDSGSGLAGYSTVWDTLSDTLPAENANLGAEATETDSPVLDDGNSHYFHIRSADTAGNLCDTAAHIGPFFIDGTSPTLVSGLSSPSHETEVCSSDTVVQVTWTPATDESSGLKGYSVLWDTSPDTSPDDTVELDPNVTETASAELPDGKDHYFHIRSIDNVGNALDEAVHIGPFYIDTTGPEMVTNLESTSHELGVWSNDDTVDVKWSQAVDQCSETDGYSTVWDSQTDTIPDEVKDIEGDAKALTSPALTDGNAIYFHIRGVDALANWGETAHLGPFFIDISKPSEATDLVSTSHTANAWSSTQVVKVSWTPAQDGGSGLAGYSSVWSTSPDTLLPAENTNLKADMTQADSPVLADGNSHYFHIRSADAAGNWGDTAAHIGPFFVDSTPPTVVSGLSSPSHETKVCSSDTVVQVTWTPATDGSSGLKGCSILWDTNPDTLPDDTVELDPGVTETSSAELPDGKDHYFHIRSIDNVGNALEKAVHIGPFYTDTTGPEAVAELESTSHELDVWSNDDTVDVQWSQAVDQCSGSGGYSALWDGQVDTLPDEVKDMEGGTKALTSPALTGGNTFYFHLRGVDALGNWSDEAAHLGPFRIDVDCPSDITDVVSLPPVGSCSSASVIKVSWAAAQDAGSGLDGYSLIWDAIPDTLPDDTMELDSDVTVAESGELSDGEHYLHIRSVDKVGNWCDAAVHIGPFQIDTKAPNLSLSPSSHELGVWSDTTIVTVGVDASDELCGVKGYSVAWDHDVDTEPEEVQNAEASKTIDSPKLADGIWYVHVRTVDNAGNWSEAEHLGPFSIDADMPSEVAGLTSATHASGLWSKVQEVVVSWSPAQDDGSGVAGYSVAWDMSPDTLPEKTINLGKDVTESRSPKLADGGEHYFHIRSVDNVGNWCDTAASIGPFNIDANPPGPVTELRSISHEISEWSSDSVLKLEWKPAVDAGWGLEGYATMFDSARTTTPDVRNLDGAATGLSSGKLADGQHYFHIRPLDKMGFWGKVEHIGPFFIDTTPPTVVTGLESTSHAMEVWSNQKVASVSWQRPTDEASGLQGFSFSWDISPDEQMEFGPDRTETSQQIADGTHYFYIKAVDKAGNWCSVARSGAFKVDTTPPHSVEMQAITADSGIDYTHVAGNALYYSGLQDAAFTVYVAGKDDVSGLKEALFSDCTGSGGIVGVESTDPQYSYSYQYEARKGASFDGRCDVLLYDHAGNSATASFIVHYDNVGPYKPTNVKCDAGAAWNTTGQVKVTWEGEVDDGSGVGDYYVEAGNEKPLLNPDGGSMNATIAAGDGESVTFYVRGLDNVGNWGVAGSASIGVDTKPPGKVQAIDHPDYDNDGQLEFNWEPATDNIRVDHYEAYVSVDDGAYKLQESTEDESCTLSGEDGHSYRLKLMAVDPAGNKGDAIESGKVVCDMTPPGFAVAMLPNPGFYNFMDIVVASLESLEGSPTLLVKLAGQSESVSLSEIVESVWVGSYTIPSEASGTATLVISGTDLAGNKNDDDSHGFSVQTVLAGLPAHIQSADGKLALNIPAGAFDRDTVVTITPVALGQELTRNLENAQLAPGLAVAVEQDELEPVAASYLISPADASILSKVILTLQYESVAGDRIGVYQWDKDASKWKYVDGSTDQGDGSISISVGKLGTFGLHRDKMAPQVSRISPPDGAVLDTSLPDFAIVVTDNGSGVDLPSLSLSIDGKMVSTRERYEGELVTFALQDELTAGSHTFSISGKDLAGNPFISAERTVHVPMWAIVPDSSQLLQNYPNPFNPETWIPYSLSESAHVSLRIYGASGQLVRTLELGLQKPGIYTDSSRAIYWDGRNENGEEVSSGVYFYQLSAGGFSAVKKMVICR